MNNNTAWAVILSAFFLMIGIACLATHSADPLWCLVFLFIIVCML